MEITSTTLAGSKSLRSRLRQTSKQSQPSPLTMLNRRRITTSQGTVTNGRKNQHGPKGFSSRGPLSPFGCPRIVSIMVGLITIVYVLFARDQPDASLSMIMDGVSNRVLDMYYSPSTASTPATLPRFPVDSETARGQGTQEPVLLEGWTLPPGSWSKEGLVSRVGEFPQYLKDSTVQPLKTQTNALCRLPVRILVQLLDKHDLLFFTNNKENGEFMKALPMPSSPRVVDHINGFQVFSVMSRHKSHSFHRHGESWLGQIEGRRQWWFLPPTTDPPPPRVNACGYLTGDSDLPVGTMTMRQEPGTVIWFPTDWYHATCALDDWTLGVGAQQGRTIRQNFAKLDSKATAVMTPEQIETTVHECLGDTSFAVENAIASPSKAVAVTKKEKMKKSQKNKQGDEKWQWFDGDLNAYYNSLEKDHNRDPTNLSDYAIHRWLGPSRSTEQQYLLLNEAAMTYMDPSNLKDPVYVLDGGCGLGSGLMWMELQHPTWKLEGYTLSEDQYSFIEKLPPHNFKAHLQSYDDLEPKSKYDFIYSIEALIHSPNATRTMEIWASHLNPGGVMAILDDFVVHEEDKEIDDMKEFAKSWLANSLFSTKELQEAGKGMGLEVVQNRFLVEEFNIISLNYRNQKPDIHPFGGRVHQGWMGSKWRQRLTVEKKLDYNLLVLKKGSTNAESTVTRETRRMTSTDDTACEAAPVRTKDGPAADYTFITPQLMSGRGKDGGEKIACISGWYCCNKGTEWWDQLDKGRTDNTAFLKLDRQLFGHYIDSFTNHLNAHFANYPSGVRGRFLDIGGTGSTASGMTQVTSKFQHFAGPLEYWKLDSDPAAKGLERTLFCDIEDCPSAETCSFDITFSHTVLEHATRPWLAFDTVARITKKGGLTMHLVPFSYQYHATPDDNYRFSHKALISLLEDRGFEVLEVGYDICTKPENMRERLDEHYDTIWLTYVIGRKL